MSKIKLQNWNRMKTPHILETSRLRLRHIRFTDAPFIQLAAAERSVSDTMISIPHPFPEGEGERYVKRSIREIKNGKSMAFVLELKEERKLCGMIEIREIERDHSQAELSFWLSSSCWGQGYMSEGVEGILHYGFEKLNLNRFYAYHMLRNPASGRVLEKNGFRREGILRQRVRKWGKFEDVALWAILRQDWQGCNS